MIIDGGVNSKKEQKSKTSTRFTQRRQIDKKTSRAKNKTEKLSSTSQRKLNMGKLLQRSKTNKLTRIKRMKEMKQTTKNLLNDYEFSTSFRSFLDEKSYLISEESLTINGYRNSFIPINVGDYIDFTTTWLRTIYGDFMALLRIDDATIDSAIKQSCDNNDINYTTHNKKPPICYCCGNPILPSDKKACDHLIPIMTMLIIVKPSSIKDNLFNIHYSCNGKKGKDNLMTLYKRAGTNYFPKTNLRNARSICREILKKNIKKIEFYPIEKIKENLERILKIKILYEKVQDEINMLTQAGKDDAAVTTLLGVNDETLAVEGLQAIKRLRPINELRTINE